MIFIGRNKRIDNTFYIRDNKRIDNTFYGVPAMIKFVIKKDSVNNDYHCWNRHTVTPSEAIEAWFKGAANESPASFGALFRWATIKNGRTIRVVWRWLAIEEKVYIITAYDFDPTEE